ncbi:Glutathione S-transferase omega-1 [Acipenser ruthenus]|uniref:Glutathione S-transferase omega-1 n=1 Tax=Acipenser ruthenus TaxID=7906 RepID=A0A444U2C7_ACIRT|nr:Glutathione S-transferase omega-1 [Acipenser ruthenus]
MPKGQVIYESPITCEYLDEVYAGNKLIPTDPYETAKQKMLVENFSKVITHYYKITMAKKNGEDTSVLEEEMKSKFTQFNKVRMAVLSTLEPRSCKHRLEPHSFRQTQATQLQADSSHTASNTQATQLQAQTHAMQLQTQTQATQLQAQTHAMQLQTQTHATQLQTQTRATQLQAQIRATQLKAQT